MRALTAQARVVLAQAHNRYLAAWRQLAAAVGDPDLCPTRLAGDAPMGEPELSYEADQRAREHLGPLLQEEPRRRRRG